ncbi:SagB/ThcOx family dehydrogenase [candidate division KSB1 bacterium]|nr:SagB/ThcOx family dehydrogenase [candidate division KSB1 bacterium]
MKRIVIIKGCLLLTVIFIFPLFAFAQEPEPIQLLKPRMDGGKPLMHVLQERHSTREYSSEKLSLQTLSELLWAAFGINRPESGKRTAPSAMNRQEIDIYVVLADGLYLYDAKTHSLLPVLARDIRALTGTQEYVGEAPLNLVYVADFGKMGDDPEENKIFYSAANTGFISQNVYLYCASAGLGTVVRGLVDKQELAKAMNLRPEQKIVLAQTVGFPKK